MVNQKYDYPITNKIGIQCNLIIILDNINSCLEPKEIPIRIVIDYILMQEEDSMMILFN